MVSKNNRLKRFEQSAQRQNHFGIRKLTIGAASVLLGTSLYLGTQTSQAKAATTDNNEKDKAATQTGDDKSTSVQEIDHVEVAKQAETLKTADQTAVNKTQEATEQSAAVSDAQKAVAQDANKAVKEEAAKQEQKATDVKKDAVKADAQEAKKNATELKVASVENKDADKQEEAKDQKVTTLSVKNLTDSKLATTKDPILKARMLGASLAAVPTAKAADAKTDDKTKNPYADLVTANSWDDVKNAASTGKAGVNIQKDINAFGDLNVNSNFIIHGTDGATLNLNQNQIKNTGNLTLADVNVNGSVMGNGTVNIEGNVTSTVNDSNGYNLSDTEKKASFTNWDQTKGYNIQARVVNVKEGASLTVNRSSIGDGIHLVNSYASVNVGDYARLNINMNTNNDLNTKARYHDAGIFAESTGNFATGYKAVVTLNTSIGQGISMTGVRPNTYDDDRFGGYTNAQSRPNGSGQINLGQHSTMNFTGRDGVILGDNSHFNVGEYANVNFENKGRGVALDLANNSDINIGDHAVTYFHSVGKSIVNARGQQVGPSGSYDGYNYIGVNEGGNITVGNDATFRVILENRGSNAWDDVVALDSRLDSTRAAFTSKKGAVVDIRDDNTDYYAELLSFPLGSSHSRIDIQDPLLLNLQRYSAGGATQGWMPIGGTKINDTSTRYTANLIYMSANNGVLSIGGSDYIVYQQIKSEGTKQLWMNVNDVYIPMSGFQTKDPYNNMANSDLSISGTDLTAGIKANQVHNSNGTPLTGKDAPYYGISTQRADHQIWIAHKTSIQLKGTHKHTITYVNEDGSPVLDASGNPLVVTQDLNLSRDLDLDITPDQVEAIKDYALTHNSDEILQYIRDAYEVTKDSNWKITDKDGNIVQNPYSAVTSPVEEGYVATIKSTNAPGVTVGANGSEVKANFTFDANDDVVQNGKLSKDYINNGKTGIPQDYETVVVYKKVEKGSVKVVYHDDTTNTDINGYGYDSKEQDAGTKVDYTTQPSIDALTDKGYVYVSTDKNVPTEIPANENVTVTVHMKHGLEDVNKNNPHDQQVEATVTRNVNYTVNGQPSSQLPSNSENVQFSATGHWDKVLHQLVDVVNGNIVVENGQVKQGSLTWTPESRTLNGYNAPVLNGYHVDSVSATSNGQDVTAANVNSDGSVKSISVNHNDKDITVNVNLVNNGKETRNEQTKTISMTVHYEGAGENTPKDNVQNVTFHYTGDVWDTTTNTELSKGHWEVNGTEGSSYKFNDVATPDVKGYTPDKENVQGVTVDPNSQNQRFVVTYKQADASLNVVYYDETAKTTLKTDTVNGKMGNAIDYSTADSIANYESQGYVLVNDGFTGQAGNDFSDANNGKTYRVTLKHGTKPVNPENPTDKYTKNDLQKQATRTINYVDNNGNKIADSVTSTVVFTGSGTIDTVTGNLVNLNPDGSIKDQNGQLTWTYSVDGGAAQKGTSYTFGATTARPTITYNGSDYNFTSVNPGNYNAGNGAVSSYLVNSQDPQNLTVDVVYNKQATFHAGKTDTKQVTRTINYLDGKTGEKIPANLIQTNPVDQKATMHRTEILDENNKVIGYGTISQDGKSYTINNNWIIDKNWDAVTSPDLSANGYKAPRFENGQSAATVNAVTVNADTKDTSVNVYYDHNLIPVGPDTPDKHGVNSDEVEKNVKETVHYVGAGEKTPADNVQNSKWTRTVTVDEVTNEIVPNGQYTTDWAIPAGEKTAYDQVNTPVVEGYYADQANVPATAVTQNDIEKTVTYKQIGKIIPVGPDGNPLPGQPTPQFPNDPTDPTKVTPGTKPDVPGYHPETGKPGDPVAPVPGDPGQDVKVPYVKDEVKKGSVQIIYHDDTTNTSIPNVGYNSGEEKAGTKVEYTTTDTIKDLENKGYVYVNTDGTIPAEIEADKNITVTVHMKHGVQPVNPENPGKPDQPINPNDPDGPKYPTGTDKDSIDKTITRTIHYEGAGEYTPKDQKQSAHFTAEGVLDKVTGKWVTPLTWSKDQTLDSVTSPKIPGYHVENVSRDKDGDNVKDVTLTHDDSDYTVTVTYAKDGEDIRDAKTLQSTQTVEFVDDQGNTLHQAVVSPTFNYEYSGDTYNKETNTKIKDGTWNADSHTFDKVNVPVIDGYVAVSGYTKDGDKVVAGGLTSTRDNLNVKTQVVYKKVGSIVPQDPNGNPIPDPNKPGQNVPNVPYVNDPNDPTKVTPNEPVPNIPRYTPSQNTVTPPDPTVDTPVIYTKNVADETVNVKYIDDTTGAEHTDLSSYDKSITAKPGEALNYTTAGSIAELENKGYKLVSDGFTAANLDGKMPEKGGNYEVHFVHTTTTITPNKPGTPGEPINPNDPDPNGPKWPSGTDAKSLTKQGTQTIHYVYTDGTKAADDSVQNTTFDHTLVFDNVTGKQIEDKGWSPASHTFDNVTSPKINGYHADKTVVNGATVTVDNPTSETTVTYAKNGTEVRDHQKVKASQLVKYVDEDGKQVAGSKNQDFTFTYTGDTYDKQTGEKVATGKWVVSSHDFTSEDVPVVDGYVAVKGFTRDDNDKVIAGGFTTTYDATDAKRNRVFTVVYKKVGKIVPVTPDHTPIPDVPTPPYVNDPNDPTKVTPDEPTPNIPGYTPSQNTVTPPDPTKDTPVVYTKNEAGLKVEYIDQDANNAVLKTDNVSGKIGEKIDYSTASSIDDFKSKGYELVSDGFKEAGSDFTDANNGKTYQVILKHGTRPVTPENPGAGYDKTDLEKEVTRTIYFVNTQDGKQVADSVKQTVNFTATGTVDKVTGKLVTVVDGKITGEGKLTWTPAQDVKAVISPSVDGMHVTYVTRDADGTNVKGVSLTHNDSSYDVYVNYAPNGTKNENGKNIPASQTIKFVDENGNTLRENNVQNSEFTRTPDVVDATTGKTITEGSWNETSHKFGTINVPVIDGYVTTVKTAGGLTATTDNPNVVTEVVYKKVGKIIPVDPSGKPIPGVPTPSYPNDPTDPTKVTPNEPVPNIPGYTPEVPTVTPEVPTNDTPVVYHPVDDTQNAQVRYIDITNNEELANSGNLSGKPGDKIVYSTADEIKALEDKGYVLVNDGFPTDAAFDNDTNHDQVFTVTFKHGTQPVTPENPGKPGEPINPNDPDGPKYPQGSDQVTKDVTRTIQYVDENGKSVSDSVEQTVKFTAEGLLDKVTGEWITPLKWSENQNVNGVKSPVVEGYHLVSVDRDKDGNNVKGVTLTHTDDSYTVTVKYAKNGKIVPVDPSGKPIPDVPQPQYPTDPTDPSKVTPNEPVPNIPGYTPEVPTVTPTDPGKDTPVKYVPVVVKDQNAVVNYVDADEGNKLITSSGNLTGKAETVINYSTKATIADLENKGYVLVNDGFPAGAKFDNDDNTTQTYTVVLKHGLVPVTPDKPGKPGQPINPNDPDGPKWPDGTDENSIKKTATQTIHYVGAGDKTPSDDVQNFDFTKKLVVDKVTGKIVEDGGWNVTSHTFGYKDTPVVEGYHADRRNAGGSVVTPDDLKKEIVVTYTANGKIVPVDPSGKPIPDVPTPQYPTDPTDPTKVTPDEPVPNIPGYKPEVPTVTPTDPGKDTPVKYVPDTQDAQGKVTYIDDTTGKTLKTDDLKGKVGDKINYTTADTIKSYTNKGYELVSNNFKDGDETFAKDGNNFEVHLKHGTTTITPDKPGNPGQPINPNDPNGPKWGNDTDAKHLRRTGTQTVHYQGAGSNTPADNVTTVVFDHSLTIDKVTGETVKDNGWTPDSHTYVTVTTPQINGYTASASQVGGDTVKSSDGNIDRSYTVTYTAVTPVTPDTPDPTPVPEPQPEPTPTPDVTPEQPDVPAPHGEDVPTKPEEEPDIPAPHGEDVPEPEQPVVVQPQAQVQKTADEPAPAPHASELPQTGSQDDNAAAIAGASIALIGLTGLIGAAKRRRKN